jgi:hypothetical protein
MLSFHDTIRTGTQMRRREFLRVGGLGLGGLSLTDLFAARAAAKMPENFTG